MMMVQWVIDFEKVMYIHFDDTGIDKIKKTFRVDMVEATISQIRSLRERGEVRPAVIIDFGLGDGTLLDDLARSLRKQLPRKGFSMNDVRLIGLGHITSPKWLKLDESIEIVWGQPRHLFEHLGKDSFDLLVSHMGLYYFRLFEFPDFWEILIDQYLSPGGRIIFNGIYVHEMISFLNERPALYYENYSSYDFNNNQLGKREDVFDIHKRIDSDRAMESIADKTKLEQFLRQNGIEDEFIPASELTGFNTWAFNPVRANRHILANWNFGERIPLGFFDHHVLFSEALILGMFFGWFFEDLMLDMWDIRSFELLFVGFMLLTLLPISFYGAFKPHYEELRDSWKVRQAQQYFQFQQISQLKIDVHLLSLIKSQMSNLGVNVKWTDHPNIMVLPRYHKQEIILNVGWIVELPRLAHRTKRMHYFRSVWINTLMIPRVFKVKGKDEENKIKDQAMQSSDEQTKLEQFLRQNGIEDDFVGADELSGPQTEEFNYRRALTHAFGYWNYSQTTAVGFTNHRALIGASMGWCLGKYVNGVSYA